MSRPRKYQSRNERITDWQRKNKDKFNYQVRKDAQYNGLVIRIAAERLTGGSVTALLNAALADYLPRALGDDLAEVLAMGQEQEERRANSDQNEKEDNIPNGN